MNVDKIVSDYFREKKVNRIVFPILGIAILSLSKLLGISYVSLAGVALLYVIAGEIISHYRTGKALTDILYEDCKAEEYWSVFSAIYEKSKGRKQKQESYIHIIQGLYAMGKLEDMEQAMDAYGRKNQLSCKNKISYYLYRIYLNSEMHPQENPKLIQEFQEFLGSFKVRKKLRKKGEDALDTWFLLERIKQNPSKKDLELLENKTRKPKSNYERFSLMDCLGTGYLKIGDREKAKNYLSQVAGVDSDFPFIQEARGLLQKEFGKTVQLFSFQNDKRRNREHFIRRKKVLFIISFCSVLFLQIFYYSVGFLTGNWKQTGENMTIFDAIQKGVEIANGEIYYGSVRESVDAESNTRTIGKAILEIDKGKYIMAFYKGKEWLDDEPCVIMTKSKIKEENGVKRYKSSTYDSAELNKNSMAISIKDIRDAIGMIAWEQEGNYKPDETDILWGVCDSKKIYQLRVDGKAPYSIVPINKDGKVFYLWCYDDLGKISDESKAKIEFVEPDATEVSKPDGGRNE